MRRAPARGCRPGPGSAPIMSPLVLALAPGCVPGPGSGQAMSPLVLALAKAWFLGPRQSKPCLRWFWLCPRDVSSGPANARRRQNAGLRWHLYHNATFYPGAGRFQKFEGDVLVKGHQRPAFDQLPRGQSGRWRRSLHIHCRPEAFLGGIYSLCCRRGARMAWQARVLEQSGTRAPAGSHPP